MARRRPRKVRAGMTEPVKRLKADRLNKHRIVVCIPICQVDADRWLTRLLANLSKVPVGVAWYGDQIEADTVERIWEFAQTIGIALQSNKHETYAERCRNYPMEMAVELGAEWMLRMDSDEQIVVEDWPIIEDAIRQEPRAWKLHWYNVWLESMPLPMIRFDPPFQPAHNYRVVLHPLKGYKWEFRPGSVASAYCDKAIEERMCDARLLHYGFSTPDLRKMHKERWDKLYSPNPYGMWNAACDEKKMAWLWPWMPWLGHIEYTSLLDQVGSKLDEDTLKRFKPSWAS